MKPKTIVQRFRISASIVISAIFFCLSFLTDSFWDDKNSIFASIFFFVGIVLVGAASLGRLWCTVYIAGYKTKTLITQGPYSVTRNPLYFLSLIGFIGVGLCSKTLLIPTLLILAFSCYYPWVIRSEETKLRMVHGEKFDAYAKSTPRFFPKISNLNEPESYTVNPKIFLRHIADTMLFPICVGALEFIGHLHKINFIPHYFSIY